MRLSTRTIIGGALLSLALPATVLASPPMLSEAKKAGMPAKNCQYCHTEAMPKKDTFKPDALNERGKFLLADKEARKLKAIDPQKLKEFPGGPEQK